MGRAAAGTSGGCPARTGEGAGAGREGCRRRLPPRASLRALAPSSRPAPPRRAVPRRPSAAGSGHSKEVSAPRVRARVGVAVGSAGNPRGPGAPARGAQAPPDADLQGAPHVGAPGKGGGPQPASPRGGGAGRRTPTEAGFPRASGRGRAESGGPGSPAAGLSQCLHAGHQREAAGRRSPLSGLRGWRRSRAGRGSLPPGWLAWLDSVLTLELGGGAFLFSPRTAAQSLAKFPTTRE